MTLREVLHAHIPTLTARSTVRDAIDKMDIYQFPALVLVGEEGEPLGILTEGDIARGVAARGSLVAMAYEPAQHFATREPQIASADCEISEALHRMLQSGLTILPVVEEGRLTGVVLRVDLMQAMLLDAEPPRANGAND